VRDSLILLIEDNADDVELTRLALRETDLPTKMVVARDGVEAIEVLLGERAIRPQLVLLDLKLPKLDGLDVLRRVRADERTRNLPVVVLSSSVEDEDLARCYALGANSYVRKPVDFARFVDVVNRLGIYWLVLNELPPELRAN
jgi:two-component system response regulator